METWTERVRKEAKGIQDRLKMTFKDEKSEYVFHFADIEAYSYGPCCPDFDLFVDIHITGEEGTKPEYHWNQALGNSLNPETRKSIKFGQEYYDAVHQKLYVITERELRVNNDELIEGLERLERLAERLARVL